VCVDSALPHLDRPFDYAIPGSLADAVGVGSRVRVRFAGRLVSAVVVSLVDASDFAGKLTPIHSSAGVPSYTPAAIELAQAIARRYGGSLWDVLRLMAPPRVASLEDRDWSGPAGVEQRYADAATAGVSAAAGLDIAELARGARVVWQALPEPGRGAGTPVTVLAAAAASAAAVEQSAIIAVPDARALAALEAELSRLGLRRWSVRGGGEVAVLDADDGANARYGSYLAAMHGLARIIIGTRPVALQPVPALGFVALWDDGSPTYDDPHAPYWNARTVAAWRAELEGAGMLMASYTPTVESLALVEHGWATLAVPERQEVRVAAPAIEVVGDDKRTAEGASGWHWMPGSVWRAATRAVAEGPVAIVVPRAGYVRAVACAACGEWAGCRAVVDGETCGGTLRQDHVTGPLVCRDCGAIQADWHCAHCHGSRIKQVRQGVERIAEQVRAMARGTDVAISAGATGVLPDAAVTQGFVVATPGAVPAVPGGYAAAVVIGAEAPASGGLGAEVRAVRWWLSVAALVRPRGEGGRVHLVGALPDIARRALETWDPVAAAREALAERDQLSLPPVRRSIQITGTRPAITLALSVSVEGVRLERHPEAHVSTTKDGALLLVTRRSAQSIIDALRARQVELSREGDETFRMRIDGPLSI
jgi:primosomal protein N' (replication factor Y)